MWRAGPKFWPLRMGVIRKKVILAPPREWVWRISSIEDVAFDGKVVTHLQKCVRVVTFFHLAFDRLYRNVIAMGRGSRNDTKKTRKL